MQTVKCISYTIKVNKYISITFSVFSLSIKNYTYVGHLFKIVIMFTAVINIRRIRITTITKTI